jgi:hypothetical protein
VLRSSGGMTHISWFVFDLELNFLRTVFVTCTSWLLNASYKIIRNIHKYSCKEPIILVRFQSNSNFLDRFLKNIHIVNVMKIRSVEAQFFHADGQSDTYDGANSQFCECIWKRIRSRFRVCLNADQTFWICEEVFQTQPSPDRRFSGQSISSDWIHAF